MARGYVSAGTLLKWRAVSGASTYQTVNNVKEAAISEATKESVPVTALSDTATVTIGGTVTDGQLTFTIFVDNDDAEHQSLVAKAKTSGALVDFEVGFPQMDAATKFVNVGGSLQGGAVTPVAGGAVEASFTYTPSGTWTATWA